MLKQVQHDIFTDFAHSATACFSGMIIIDPKIPLFGKEGLGEIL
jgi:hypothetical protein